jgi:hypothetical protein
LFGTGAAGIPVLDWRERRVCSRCDGREVDFAVSGTKARGLSWSLGPASRPRYACDMCGRARLFSDVSEIKLVFSISPERPSPNIAPSWNVALTDPLLVIRYDARAGERS